MELSGTINRSITLSGSMIARGLDGRGIVSIAKTGTSGLVDTYTITYTDETTSTFTVTNGANGQITATSFAEAFSSSKAYAVGDYVVYSGQLYQFTTAHAAGAWNASHATAVQIADQVSELKSAVNNSIDLTQYTWVVGSLAQSGTNILENNTSTTRVRSPFIEVSPGTIIAINDNTNCLVVYYCNNVKECLGATTWGKQYIVPDGVAFVRILIRKNESNETITSEEISTQVARCSANFQIPYDFYTKIFPLIDGFVGGDELKLELGSISAGNPTPSNQYVRSVDFVKAHRGDVLFVKPTSFNIVGGSLYLYATADAASYSSAVTFNPTANTVFSYYFKEDCYFKIRAAKGSYDVLSTSDIPAFESATDFVHYYNHGDFVTIKEEACLALDYDTLASSMSGKVNLALQTDTHMSLYDGYKYDGAVFAATDFDVFKKVLNSIGKLPYSVFINLGDIVRGYEFDPDYETRASIDKIMSEYDGISVPKLFLVGNHDDGNMWYNDGTRYNQKKGVDNVLYPNEQFNRIVKRGSNNGKNQPYYYVDINGVRFITLYQRDFDYSQSIPSNNSFAIGADQLTWLSGTALDTELPVVILTHAPLLASLYANGGTGFSDALTSIESFASGGGTVIAVLSGHTHEQAKTTQNDINHIVFANGYNWFESISIDLANRTLTAKAINKTLADISVTY